MLDEMRLRFGISMAASLLDNLSNKALDSASARLRNVEEFRFRRHAAVERLADGDCYLLGGSSRLGRIDDRARCRSHAHSVADYDVGFAEASRCRVDRDARKSGAVTPCSGNGEMNDVGHHVGKPEDVERTLV
jgi:hypothetical protein